MVIVVKDETLVPDVPIRVRDLKSDAGIAGNDQLILVLCFHFRTCSFKKNYVLVLYIL